MGTLETNMLAAYKDAVEFYNLMCQDDTVYASGQMAGIEECAQRFGCVLYAHHKNDCIGLPYDYITIARRGRVLEKIIL